MQDMDELKKGLRSLLESDPSPEALLALVLSKTAPTDALTQVAKMILSQAPAAAPRPGAPTNREAYLVHRGDPGALARLAQTRERTGELESFYDAQGKLDESQLASVERAALLPRLVALVHRATGPGIRSAVESELAYRLFDDSARVRKATAAATAAIGAVALLPQLEELVEAEADDGVKAAATKAIRMLKAQRRTADQRL
ncbi:MAG: hypothetical protein HYV63_33725 [Candidatus Schekmanbacteria bacterium]|nr:hypothetical protein [Candidatus Schekmanbacteria bacterium]